MTDEELSKEQPVAVMDIAGRIENDMFDTRDWFDDMAQRGAKVYDTPFAAMKISMSQDVAVHLELRSGKKFTIIVMEGART